MAQEQGEQRHPHRLIGERLAGARLAAGLTEGQVSERTRITPEMLRWIEAGEFEQCGGDVYARGHIRAYAQAVGLDPAPLLAEYGAIRLPPLTKRDLRKPRVAPQPAREAAGATPRAAQQAAAQRARSVLPTIVPGAVPSLVPMAGSNPPPEVPPLTHRRREDFTDADAGSAAALIAGTGGHPAVNERPAAFLVGAKGPTGGGPNWSLALIGALAAVGLVAAVQLWPSTPGASVRAGSGASTAHTVSAPQPKPAGAEQSVAPVLVSPSASVASPSPSAAPKNVVVRLTAGTSSSWVTVTNSAGQQLYSNALQPGQSQEFTDPIQLNVVLSNPSAVDVVVNGRDLGPQSASPGQAFHASYGPASGG